MFLHYFRLREQPFGVTPDPSFLYLSDTHREALASLIYGIEAGIGFSAVIAKPGMGKTTLLYALLKYFQNSSRSAFLFDTQCDSRELIQNLLEEFEIDQEVQAHGTPAITSLRQFLLRNARAKRQVLVVVDEAQNLDTSAFETLRLLSNFETPQAKLLQIILSGQPQLARKLGSQELEQLRQRIPVFCHLKAFTPKETVLYIAHRLRHAGYCGAPLFTPEALSVLVANTFGIPREINRICFNALSLGFAIQKQVIDAEVIQEVIADLEVDGLLNLKQDANPTGGYAAGGEELAALFRNALVRDVSRAEVAIDTDAATDRGLPYDVSSGGSEPSQQIAYRDDGWTQVQREDPAGRYRQPSKTGGIVTLGLSASDGRSFSRTQKHETRMGAVLRRCGLSSLWAKEATSQRVTAARLERDSVTQPEIRKQMQASIFHDQIQAPAESQEGFSRRTSEPASPFIDQGDQSAPSPRLLRRVEPIYPDQARAQRLTGEVTLDARIRNTGEVGEVYALSGHPILTAAAVDAVRQWLYAPALLNGKPQPSRKIVVVEFSLQ